MQPIEDIQGQPLPSPLTLIFRCNAATLATLQRSRISPPYPGGEKRDDSRGGVTQLESMEDSKGHESHPTRNTLEVDAAG